MRMIAIAKSPLQDAERRRRGRLLIATNMRFLLAPSIFQTALLVGWKGPRFATAKCYRGGTPPRLGSATGRVQARDGAALVGP